MDRIDLTTRQLVSEGLEFSTSLCFDEAGAGRGSQGVR